MRSWRVLGPRFLELHWTGHELRQGCRIALGVLG
jgi:hypothetical protein